MATPNSAPKDNQDRIEDIPHARDSTRATFIVGALQIALTVGILLLAVFTNRVLLAPGDEPLSSISNTADPSVNIAIPSRETVSVIVKETGVAQVQNSISLTPEASGRIVLRSPNLVPGGAFQKGELLFRVDPATTQAAVNQAKANLQSAQSDYELQKAEADIAKNEWALLNPSEPIPDMVARKPQINKARAAIASAKANLQSAELNRKRVDYRLPFDGRVLDTNLDIGTTVSTGQSYGTVFEPGSLEFSVSISSQDLQALSPAIGRKATIRIQNQDLRQVVKGMVTRVDPTVDDITRLAKIYIVPDRLDSISPGAFSDVEIIGPEITGALVVPGIAIGTDNFIWVVKDGLLNKRRPGIIRDDGEIIFTQPFDFGDGIVTTQLPNARIGMAVNVLDRE